VKLAVVGCGAIGGVVGAFLHKAGADVVLVDTNQAHVDAIRQRGLLIDGDGVEPTTVYPPIVANANEISEPLDVVFLAVKSVATRAAAQSVLPHLKPSSIVVALQNGMGNEEIIANIVGPDRVLAGVVGWGATFTGPGHITRTSSDGGFEIGEWGGGVTQRTREVAAVLSKVAPTVPMSNILGVKWTKLIINATINSLGAALGRRLGEMVADPRSRLLMLQLITEAVTVAHAEGVQLEKVNGKLNMGLLVLESHEQERARHRAGGARRLCVAQGGLVLLGVGRPGPAERRSASQSGDDPWGRGMEPRLPSAGALPEQGTAAPPSVHVPQIRPGDHREVDLGPGNWQTTAATPSTNSRRGVGRILGRSPLTRHRAKGPQAGLKSAGATTRRRGYLPPKQSELECL